MAASQGPLYEGLDEIQRLVASIERKMNQHDTCPIYGVAQALNLGFEGSVLNASDTLCAGIALKDGDPPTKMTKTQIDGIIFGAIKFTEKLDKKGDLGELTQDMAAAIYVYTCESPFYKQLNTLLRDEDRTALQPFFPYLRLLLTALRRLPKIERNVYRGVGLDLQDQYPEGETVVWWALSSTTKTMKVLKDFLGESGKRTIFIVEVKSARDIMKYSWKTTEDELILLPGTVFKVTSVLPQGDLTMVNMEEDLTAPDMIDSGEDDYQMCDPESFYAVLEPDDAVQYAPPIGSSGGGGGKAAIPKVFQCERPNPRGGNCKNRRAGDGKFCKGHSCTHSGCSASKSTKDAFCDQHSDGDARTDGNGDCGGGGGGDEEVDVDPLGYIKANVLDTMISRAPSTEERTVQEAKRKAFLQKLKLGGGGGGGAPSQSKAPAGRARAYQNQLAITKQEQRHWTITLLRCGNFAVCQKVETKEEEAQANHSYENVNLMKQIRSKYSDTYSAA
eukprot:gene24848-30236_t